MFTLLFLGLLGDCFIFNSLCRFGLLGRLLGSLLCCFLRRFVLVSLRLLRFGLFDNLLGFGLFLNGLFLLLDLRGGLGLDLGFFLFLLRSGFGGLCWLIFCVLLFLCVGGGLLFDILFFLFFVVLGFGVVRVFFFLLSLLQEVEASEGELLFDLVLARGLGCVGVI